MTSSCHHSKISNTFVLHERVATKNDDTQKIGFVRLNKIKEVELDYMEHVLMHMKCHGRGHTTSRSLKVIVKLYLGWLI